MENVRCIILERNLEYLRTFLLLTPVTLFTLLEMALNQFRTKSENKHQLTFSRSPSRTLALTRPATNEISNRSGDSDSALVSNSSPAALAVLKRNTNSSVCVRLPCAPPSQIVMCCVPLKANVVDSLPHVGPLYNVAVQSHSGRFHPSLQIPLF